MKVANPNNDFLPSVGQWVKIVGACHPRLLGAVVYVDSVEWDEEEQTWFIGLRYYEEGGTWAGWMYTSGVYGGLEPYDGPIPNWPPYELSQK